MPRVPLRYSTVGVTLLIAAAGVLVGAGTAPAKEIKPGDIQLCNLRHCRPVSSRTLLARLGALYYDAGGPSTAREPAMGSPVYYLRFRSGYTTGIVAGADLDRFLSYGVNEDRFVQGTWYRLPGAAAAALKRLARGMKPIPLVQSLVDRSM
jgi:hypothetical protein